MEENICLICDKASTQLCGRCHVARYCSVEHQKAHWKSHKTNCFPCRIEYDERLGRHLVASKDIKAGEAIISDSPLVVGPQYSIDPICLGCNGPVDKKFKCKACGYPLCSPSCPNVINHQRECQMIQLGGKKANVTSLDRKNPVYQCITPLRCLWMRERAKDKWEALVAMEAHLKERRESGRCEEVKNFIVFIIRNYFQLEIFSEEEIQTVCGILETNAFEVPELNLIALYGFGYLLEHSCVPNTTRTFDARLNLVISAAMDIKAGEHITTSYINPFWGERIRKLHLMKFKYFECSCLRCVDATDLNTHLSSVKCQSCYKGFLLPPKDVTSNWVCNACGKEFEASEIERNLVSVYEQNGKLAPTVNALEKFLKETRKFLSENHQYRIETKLALAQMYGRGQDSSINKLSDDEIIRKRELCNEVMEVTNLLAPGLSRIRGIVLYELHSTYAEKYRRMHKKFKQTQEGKNVLEKAEEILTRALEILKLETHLKEEMEMTTDGECQLRQIKKRKEDILREEQSIKNSKGRKKGNGKVKT